MDKKIEKLKQKLIKKDFGDIKTARLKYYEKLIEEIDNITDEAKEECAKEKRILIRWLKNLNNKIMRYDEFKGLRGYPLTSFRDKYLSRICKKCFYFQFNCHHNSSCEHPKKPRKEVSELRDGRALACELFKK